MNQRHIAGQEQHEHYRWINVATRDAGDVVNKLQDRATEVYLLVL